MADYQLSFASGEDSLIVRRFSVSEEMSSLFEVSIVARSPDDDLDLDSFVGKGAAFRFAPGDGRPGREWNGVCARMEQVEAESNGLSTYLIRIVPALWRTTLRRNNRIFQHVSVPSIVKKILAEWAIVPVWKIDEERYPKLEYRVQYGETDFAFMTRLLEEAGISFTFTHGESDGAKPAGDDDKKRTADDETRLVFLDKPPSEPRAGGPLPWTSEPSLAMTDEIVTRLSVSSEVKPGRVTVRDFDFRHKPDYQLVADKRAESADAEDHYEQYHYSPGAFLVEVERTGATPFADDKGAARADEKGAGADLVDRRLDAERRDRRQVVFDTNAMDIGPGVVFSIDKHPRAELAVSKLLFVVATTIVGTANGEWRFTAHAVFRGPTYRPLRRTPKPRVVGVQSAVVVGPQGEEIHTDEFGRIRVQFHWDREGRFDDQSSCWIRVSQGWAGSGWGMICLPRIGQEVLVDFFDGDPDQPVIVGRVYNNTTRVPYTLPLHKTQSGWRSDSTPGSGGFNEIKLEDAKGREVFSIQAERDYVELVKRNQTSTILANRATSVGANDATTVGKNQTLDVDHTRRVTVGDHQINHVGASRTSIIGVDELVEAGRSHAITVASGTGTLITDRSIVVTTKDASIVIDGSNILLDAKGSIRLTAQNQIILSAREIFADGDKGSPSVNLNCAVQQAPAVPALSPARTPELPKGPWGGGEINKPAELLSGSGELEAPGGFEETVMKALPAKPADAPKAIAMPAEVAKDITKAVEEAKPAASLAEAPKALLTKAHLQKTLDIAKALKAAKETKGMSLLGIGEVKDAVGVVVTKPILGGISGVDIADLLNQGQALGIVHLSPKTAAAAALVRGAAPDGTANKVTDFLGKTVTKPMFGELSLSDVADLVGQGADANLFKVSKGGADAISKIRDAAANAPAPKAATDAATDAAKDAAKDVEKPQAVMLLKTQGSPAAISGEAIDAQALALHAGGMPANQAMLSAMAGQGVVAYAGDSDGVFTKLST